MGHLLKHPVDPAQGFDAGVRIGGCACGVKFHRVDQAIGKGGRDVLRVRLFGQVKGHQRLEGAAIRQGCKDAVAVGAGVLGRDHGGHQVRHDDGAREVAGGFRQDGAHHCAIAQVQVPVVGAADAQCVGHCAGVL